MRVAAVVEQCLAPVPGGTGRYAAEVVRALSERPGLDVETWTAWHRSPERAEIRGVRGPRRLPLPRRGLIAAWERGLGPVPRGADLVHAPTLLAPPRRDRPLVVTLHDTVPWTHPETLTPRGVSWHRAMAERVAHTADAVVVPTWAVADALVAHLTPRAVHVIGEGVGGELTTPPPDADDRAVALDLPPDGYLLSLATLEPRKGLDVLIRALAEPSDVSLPLIVVGQSGWGGVDVMALAESHGLSQGRVRLLGRVSDADLAVVLSRATVLVVPSRAEGFGLPVLEGMAAGVPVVTSSDPALVETGGSATRTAGVGDHRALAAVIADVVQDPSERDRMVSAGLVVAARSTWAKAAGDLTSLYESLV